MKTTRAYAATAIGVIPLTAALVFEGSPTSFCGLSLLQ